jgi:hypothetical protein
VTCACHPRYQGGINRITVQASLGKYAVPHCKITKAKKKKKKFKKKKKKKKKKAVMWLKW